ncbi:MAG: phosphate-binding protein [Candidatus Rokuibacteriota bacterium]|nr:MAG: phosphate-binding protein [Candidatus Rokubacteria bacterium]
MQKGTRTLGGGLRPPSEASPQDVVRAAGRRGAGDPPSEASDPEVRAAGRRGAGDPPSEASDPELARAKPALEAEHRAVGDRSRTSCPLLRHAPTLAVGLVVAVVLAGAGPGTGRAQTQLDPALHGYRAVSGVSGNISSVGSDTLNNLMTHWAETFQRFYPNAKVQIEGKGSSTAPPALITGTAQLGPMSREMKGTEVDQFEKKYGYKPTPIRTSVDALAVFVNKDNPIKCLSVPQVDAIFSKSRRQGGKEDIVTWGQLGLTGEWANKPISLYGRNSASGTYGFFKEHTLKNGDYKDTVKEQPGSAAVVQGVTVDRYGAGYGGIGYATAGVRAVPLSEKDAGKCVEATADNAYSGAYPLARFLYVYINKAPGKPLDPLTREFVKLIVSKQGQEGVIKDGYFPIPASIAKEELSKVQ